MKRVRTLDSWVVYMILGFNCFLHFHLSSSLNKWEHTTHAWRPSEENSLQAIYRRKLKIIKTDTACCLWKDPNDNFPEGENFISYMISEFFGTVVIVYALQAGVQFSLFLLTFHTWNLSCFVLKLYVVFFSVCAVSVQKSWGFNQISVPYAVNLSRNLWRSRYIMVIGERFFSSCQLWIVWYGCLLFVCMCRHLFHTSLYILLLCILWK